MYIVIVLMMFFKGFADALMIRLQQALAVGASQGLFPQTTSRKYFPRMGQR